MSDDRWSAISRMTNLFARMVWIGLIVLAAGLVAAVLLPSGNSAFVAPILGSGLTMILGGLLGRRHFAEMARRLEAR